MKKPPTFIELPSAPMQAIYDEVQQVHASNIEMPFFIIGETGVGKEGIVEYIHANSLRRDKPLVAINCGRFSAELLQSELFGHEKGAFTGADQQRRGTFEEANRSTLFLDEITEMSLDAQKMFLRFLDTNKFTRLGGNQVLTSDVQIIAATNIDVDTAIAEQKFRVDLYYRLSGVVLKIPPLRERTEDIAPLVNLFIAEHNVGRRKTIKGFTPEALARLEQARWPGNIRQLRNTIRVAIAHTTADTLELADFPHNFSVEHNSQQPLRKQTPSHSISVVELISQLKALPAETQYGIIRTCLKSLPRSLETEIFCAENMSLRDVQRQVVQARMAKHPTLAKAAASLGIDRRTLKAHAESNTDGLSYSI